MKVKEIPRTANVAWSPATMQTIHVACGTVAQQLDATFSTSARLEVFTLDLAASGLNVPLTGTTESLLRFHKLAWSAHGQEGVNACGVIAGGSDNGTITLWSADKIISGAEGSQILQTVQHTGPVRTIDFNPFQANLLASGAGESEIFIWDLNNPDNPMSPGNKIHPLEDISGVAWNRQVQHILASTSPSGRSIVWDLRKNEPIIQVADPNSRMHCNAISWHLDVATQMVTASGDDRSPVVQLWDLRFATSPMRTLERHKKGILSLSWCAQDSDLLLSAAKDNLVLCWNPNSDVAGGEVVYELPATTQWIFECHWCPRNPSIISTASFDGHVTMYSLLGGGITQHEEVVTEAVQSSDDPFANLTTRPQQQPVETTPLKKPPKWFRRPCGARFAFGGKLVSFAADKSNQNRSVHISQVVTEKVLLNRSVALESALGQQDFAGYCGNKASQSSKTSEQNLWDFLRVTFEPDARRQYLRLLGYDEEEMEQKLSKFRAGAMATGGIDPSDLSHRLSSLPLDNGEGEGEGEGETAAIFGTDDGNCELELTNPSQSPLKISTDDDVEGALSKALLVGNFEAAVDICIGDDRMAEAMVLAVAGGAGLFKKTQQAFFLRRESEINRLMSSIVNRDWTQLVRVCNLDNWREVLAALVTYASPDEFSSLCDLLGERLESEVEGRYRDNANLCYICSGNVDRFVQCWNKTANGSPVSAEALQDLMEKVVLLQRAVERERKQFSGNASAIVAEKFRAYSGMLASQGSLATALSYLEMCGTSVCGELEAGSLLHDRLYQAQGGKPSGLKPKLPFQMVDVQPQRMVSGPNQLATSATAQPQIQSTTGGPYAVPNPTPSNVSNPYQRTNIGSSQQSLSSSPYAPYNPTGKTGQSGITTSGEQPRTGAVPTFPVGGGGGGSSGVSHVGRSGQHVSMFNPAAVPVEPVPRTGLTGSAPHPTPTMPSSMPQPPYSNSPLPTWNDPPAISNKKKVSSVPAPMMPITAPVMPQPGMSVAQQQVLPTSDNQRQPSPSPVATQPPSQPVVAKPPIPPEHQHMVTAFESILTNCRAAANNTSMKKKTEDISKKLAILCDLLRESKISPDVLAGLHYIAQESSSLNYTSALAMYSQMVSAGNFSEISSFMPGIKSLLHMAEQLRRVQT